MRGRYLSGSFCVYHLISWERLLIKWIFFVICTFGLFILFIWFSISVFVVGLSENRKKKHFWLFPTILKKTYVCGTNSRGKLSEVYPRAIKTNGSQRPRWFTNSYHSFNATYYGIKSFLNSIWFGSELD